MRLTEDRLKTYPKKIRTVLSGLALGTERASGTPKAKYLKRMLKNTLRVHSK